MTPTELADLLGLRPRTLEEHRRLGRGPAYVRLSGRRNVRYRASDVKAWLDALGAAS
ncbi:MAG: helix-turn-helix transcriptional regulator [bacterium]